MFVRKTIFDGMVSYTDFPEQVHLLDKRNDKIKDIRNQISSGNYNENEHLNIILDKILEDILT